MPAFQLSTLTFLNRCDRHFTRYRRDGLSRWADNAASSAFLSAPVSVAVVWLAVQWWWWWGGGMGVAEVESPVGYHHRRRPKLTADRLEAVWGRSIPGERTATKSAGRDEA